MTDPELVDFLRSTLPAMGLRWRGFKGFRNTIRKRLLRRLGELGMDLGEYRHRIEVDPRERVVFDAMCRITISRLYRDRAVIERLRKELPRNARVWSAGCASGEEPYTIALIADDAAIVATDIDAALIARARDGRYRASSLRELPPDLRARGFTEDARGDGVVVVRDELRARVDFRVQDLRAEMPEGPFDAILCRNCVFTYFDEPVQTVIAREMLARLAPQGVLVIGGHESLPPGLPTAQRAPCIFELSSARCVGS